MSIIFLSIVIMLLLIFFLFMSKSKRPLFSGLLSKYIAFFYIVLLLLSSLAVYILPEKAFIQNLEDQNQQISQAHEITASIFDIAQQGELDNTPGIYKKADLSFQIAGDRLELASTDSFDFHDIFVKRKESDNGLVQVSSYMTSSLVNGIDVTPKILPPVIKLEGNKLKISPLEHYELNYTAFKPDFTTEQFTRDIMRS